MGDFWVTSDDFGLLVVRRGNPGEEGGSDGISSSSSVFDLWWASLAVICSCFNEAHMLQGSGRHHCIMAQNHIFIFKKSVIFSYLLVATLSTWIQDPDGYFECLAQGNHSADIILQNTNRSLQNQYRCAQWLFSLNWSHQRLRQAAWNSGSLQIRLLLRFGS